MVWNGYPSQMEPTITRTTCSHRVATLARSYLSLDHYRIPSAALIKMERTKSTMIQLWERILWISRMVYRTSVCIAISWRARQPRCWWASQQPHRQFVQDLLLQEPHVDSVPNCWIESNTSWRTRTTTHSRSSVICTCWSVVVRYWQVLHDNIWPPFLTIFCHNSHRSVVGHAKPPLRLMSPCNPG